MSQLWVQAAGHDFGENPYEDPDTGLHLPVPGLHGKRHTSLVPVGMLTNWAGDERGRERDIDRAQREMGAAAAHPEDAFMGWQRNPRHTRFAPVALMRHPNGRIRMTRGHEYVHGAMGMELESGKLEGFHALPTEITDMRHPGRADGLPPLYHGTSTAGLEHIRPAVQHGGLEYAQLHSPEADHHFAYATANINEATSYARAHGVIHDAEPIIYRVHPLSQIEPDPPHNPADHLKLNERIADVRDPEGFRVIGSHHPGPGW